MHGIFGVAHLGGAGLATDPLCELLEQPSRAAAGLPLPRTVPGAVLVQEAFGPRPIWRTASNDGAWVVADARLDGRGELITALNLAGIAATAATPDADLAAGAWRAWGRDCVERLEGDFALAAWDEHARVMFCARSAFGVSPLYWAGAGELVLFSSDMTPLTRVIGVDLTLDTTVLGDFLLFGDNIDTASTIFRGIRRLAAGNSLVATRDESISRAYFELRPGPDVRHRDPRDYVREYQELFEQAVLDRVDDQRASIMLSGGTDSAAVAALAARAGVTMRAATLDARPIVASDDESVHARQAAASAGIEHQVFEVRGEDFFAPDAPTTPFPVDGAFLGAVLRAERYLGAHAAATLTGRGGDVALAGSKQALRNLVRRGRLLEGARAARRYARMRGSLRGFGIRTLWRDGEGGGSGTELPGWIRTELVEELHLRERLATGERPRMAPDGIAHDTAWSMLTDTVWQSSFELDLASRPPVRYRHPFWDLRLLRWLLAIPPLPWCRGKTIHREAMRGILPEALRERPKTPLAEDPIPLLLRDSALADRALTGAREAAAWIDIDRFSDALDEAAAGSPASVWSLTAPISLGRWLADQSFAQPPVEL